MKYFLYKLGKVITSKHLSWYNLLPVNRANFIDNNGKISVLNQNLNVTTIRYKDYYNAIIQTLEENNFTVLSSILNKKTGVVVPISSIKFVSIFLEKHGAFYHPSKIEIRLRKGSLFFVVNVAISKEGKTIIDNEVKTLKMLNNTVPLNFIPRIYAYSNSNPSQLPMFFGEWFTDFHEFHLSKYNKIHKNNIIIWDPLKKNFLLSIEKTKQLYYQIAMIISLYYDPFSTDHISHWHNASGDFVINVNKNNVQIRLISARRFDPMLIIENEESYLDIILHALTIFMIHISINIRVDRLDGVGEIVLADDEYIPYILKGFFQGLLLSNTNKNYPRNFPKFFKKYISIYSKNELLDLAVKIVDKSYKKRLEESLVIKPILDKHITQLHISLKTLCVCC